MAVPRDLLVYVCKHAEDPEALKLCEKYAGALGEVIAGKRRWLWVTRKEDIELAKQFGLKVYEVKDALDRGCWVSTTEYSVEDLIEASLIGALLLYASEHVLEPRFKPGFLAKAALARRISVDARTVPGLSPFGLAPPHRVMYIFAYSFLLTCILHEVTRYTLFLMATPGIMHYTHVLGSSKETALYVSKLLDELLCLVKAPARTTENLTAREWLERLSKLSSQLGAQIHRRKYGLLLTTSFTTVFKMESFDEVLVNTRMPVARDGKCMVSPDANLVFSTRQVYNAFVKMFVEGS